MKKYILLFLLLLPATVLADYKVTSSTFFNAYGTPSDADSVKSWLCYDLDTTLVDSATITNHFDDKTGRYFVQFAVDYKGCYTILWEIFEGDDLWNDVGTYIVDDTMDAEASVSPGAMAQIAHATYDTMYLHRTDFHGGVGSGPIDIIVSVLDVSDSSAVSNVFATMVRWDGTGDRYIAKTNSSGIAVLKANTNDSIRLSADGPSGMTFETDSVIVDVADLYDTVWATRWQPDLPESPFVCKIWGHLFRLSGQPLDSADVKISAFPSIYPIIEGSGAMYPNIEMTVADTAGYFEIEVVPDTAITYRFLVSKSGLSIPLRRLRNGQTFRLPADSNMIHIENALRYEP